MIDSSHSRVYGVAEALPATTARADDELMEAAILDGTRKQADVLQEESY